MKVQRWYEGFYFTVRVYEDTKYTLFGPSACLNACIHKDLLVYSWLFGMGFY